ncbi:hypothetical protein DFR44_13018 [Hydromonas duriensis]|uniref:Uncharacterized protein n=1 Tax=Hydromonas duriensis TaxID=1527608 RepID=A0A4R6Y4F0_9BURK|nr:hypothetical protein DFR44_13018 [Hydromonas duriensis]
MNQKNLNIMTNCPVTAEETEDSLKNMKTQKDMK